MHSQNSFACKLETHATYVAIEFVWCVTSFSHYTSALYWCHVWQYTSCQLHVGMQANTHITMVIALLIDVRKYSW